MLRLILNDEHLGEVLGQTLGACRHRVFIATADVKDLFIPDAPAGRRGRRGRRHGRSIIDVFHELSARGVEVRLLHGGVPSGAFLRELKGNLPALLRMRRCPRVHAKAVIADGRLMYLGSANLTGAGLGAKSPRRRNFEASIWTDDTALIDPALDMLDGVFSGEHCEACGRREHCPVPLEEPRL